MNRKNRHRFQRDRLLKRIEQYERELLNSRQSWEEYIYLHNMRAILNNMAVHDA